MSKRGRSEAFAEDDNHSDEEDREDEKAMEHLSNDDMDDRDVSPGNEDEEGNEEEEGDEDEGEGQGDGEADEYQLQFEDGMDPMAFAEHEEGVAPFQQFEKLEYEVLAARKREALATKRSQNASKAANQSEIFGASIDEIWDTAKVGGLGGRGGSAGGRRRKRKKKIGRPKGSTVTPEIKKKLGEANIFYAVGKFDEALEQLKEIVRLAPNVPDSYHTLGLLHEAMGDRKKALNFYMIAAHLTPKDPALWKCLASWSMEQGNMGQVIYCLTKAIKADSEDVDAKWDRASLYAERNEFSKAAEAFEQMLRQRPNDAEVCKMVAKMYHKTGQHDHATMALEKLLQEHPADADFTAVNLLAELHMEKGNFATAIAHIDHARGIYCPDQVLPLDLAVKAGICHAYLGNLEDAESYFEELPEDQVEGYGDLIMDVGDAYLALGEHLAALRYYQMLTGDKAFDNMLLHLKMAHCHAATAAVTAAITMYYKVLDEDPDHVEARLTLASLHCDKGEYPEAVSVLSPANSDLRDQGSNEKAPWWKNGSVLKKLAAIHYSKGDQQLYLKTILPAIQESLFTHIPKVKKSKTLPKRVLLERSKWLEERPQDEVFHGFRPVLSTADSIKATRARRILARHAVEKEEKKAAASAAGLDYDSKEDSEDEPPPDVDSKHEVPLPDLLKDEEHYEILVQCCKTLAASNRHWEAIEIIQHVLQMREGLVLKEKSEELRALGAQISFQTKDAKYGFICVRHSVLQRPYSTSAWNRYYQVISRSEIKVQKHNKFLLQMRKKYPDCAAPMIICGHQFNLINQQQGAIRDYLQAYKLQREDPFINLCVGTAFINLSLGFRLTNRNQCVMQGFAFLYRYQKLAGKSQESYYNLARAYHHVGLLQLAVNYYEKVLNCREKDHPIVPLPHETTTDILLGNSSVNTSGKVDPGHCNLHREAAYNLHLIYMNSGATHLARQLLKDYVTV